MLEKVFMHKIMIALGMFRRQADVFVHIERNHVCKRELSRLDHFYQPLIHSEGGGTGRQPKHKGLFRCRAEGFYLIRHIMGSP